MFTPLGATLRARTSKLLIASFVGVFVLPSVVAAQDSAPSRAEARVEVAPESALDADTGDSAASPTGDDHGFVLRSDDGAHSLRLAALMQLQYAHDWGHDSSETDALFVNRARVGLLGSVFSRDLRYLLVAELGGDVRLLFLTVDYTVVPDWLTIRVGQFKRPFSRSFITMAGQMSMIDRPSTVGPDVFGDGVDVGLMLHNGSTGVFEYAVGVFGGSASSMRLDRVDPLLAVRLGYNIGTVDGYSESDLEGGAPRFGIAAAGLVDCDADGDHDAFTSVVVDFAFKAYGFSLTSAIYVGARQGGQHWLDQRLRSVGHYTQIGYLVAHAIEPVLRYSVLASVDGSDTQHDFEAGLNVYFHGHALKLQNVVRVRLEDQTGARDVRLQSQLSFAL